MDRLTQVPIKVFKYKIDLACMVCGCDFIDITEYYTVNEVMVCKECYDRLKNLLYHMNLEHILEEAVNHD